MVCQKDCVSCGSTDNVMYVDKIKEFLCEDCKDELNYDDYLREESYKESD